MKQKHYDEDVRGFIQQQNGLLLVVSNDPLFNKNLRGTLTRHLSIKDDCVQNVFSGEALQKEIKQLVSKNRRLLVFIERELSGKPTTELIRYLKNDYPGILMVVLTTEVEREKLILLHEIGADNFITKPISPDTLIEKIAFTVKPRSQIGEHMDLGKQKLLSKEFDEVVSIAKQVLEIKPNSPAGLLLLGDALKGMGRKQEALAAYTQAEKHAKLFLEPLKKIAELHKEEGNVEEELKFLEKLDRLSPLNVDRKVDIGNGYMRMGNKEKAKEAFDDAVKIATKEAMETVARVTQNISTLCMEAAPELSEQYLRQTLESKKGMLDKNDIETFNRLGITLRKQGKWQDAIKEYRKAIKITPSDGALYYNISMACMEGKEFHDAPKYLDKALSLSPEIHAASEVVSYNIATVYRRAGRQELVIKYLQKALEINPGFTKAKAMLRDISSNGR